MADHFFAEYPTQLFTGEQAFAHGPGVALQFARGNCLHVRQNDRQNRGVKKGRKCENLRRASSQKSATDGRGLTRIKGKDTARLPDISRADFFRKQAHSLCSPWLREIVLGEHILTEVEQKLTKKLKVPRRIVRDYTRLLRDSAEVVKPTKVARSACRDPQDLAVLGLLAPGRAEMLVSGDKDLLVLGEFSGARILSPRQFWEAVGKGGGSNG